MKGVSGLTLVVIALAAVGSRVNGQGLLTPEVRIQQTQAQLDGARQKLQLATSQLERTQRQYDAGAASQAELSIAQMTVAQARTDVASLEAGLAALAGDKQRSDRLEALHQPVSVELRESSVRQAAQILSQASGLPISVDKAVPTDKRLTVVAQAVPLATVLDTIARQAGLEIATQGNGILLRVTPTLEVNGQRTEIVGPFEPWSAEWGQNPAGGLLGQSVTTAALPNGGLLRIPHGGSVMTAPGGGVSVPEPPEGGLMLEAPTIEARPGGLVRTRPGVGPSGYSIATPGGVGTSATAPEAAPAAPGFSGPVIGGFGGFGTVQPGALPVAMTALSSSTFVVASPAPGGEAGVTLTVYRLEGSQLRKVSSTVQRLGPAGGSMGALYGTPGGHVYRVAPGGAYESAPLNPPAANQAGGPSGIRRQRF